MAELSRPIDREFNVEVEGGRFSTSFLNDLVDTHVNKIAPRYVKFQKLYEGKHKIQNRPRKDKNKPNNKLVNDFFGQTIDNTVGYFLGNPIVLNYTEPKKDKAPVEADPADVGVDLTELEDTAVQDELDKICSDNDKDDLFIEWGKEAMIKGLSHILVYQDEESHTKMMRVSPEDLIVVYKNSSTKEPAYKIRLYDIDTEDTKRTTHYAEVYSPTKIEIFKSVDDGSCGATGKGKARQFASYEFVEEKSHIFGRIPIITVYNNEEQMSDLEKIETLVNDYDKVLSDVSNEFEAFRNAYLMLKNMVAGNDSIQKLKDEGIVEVMENGDMKFITKEIQTEALENHLNRLEKNIHKFSAVPDLSDENFAGNLSGVAIRFKLFIIDDNGREFVDGVGIPIGNYVSQYDGNFNLSVVDHWLKEVKGVKYYFRYMDDMVIFGSSKEELHKLKRELDEFMAVNLKQVLKHNWQVFPTKVRGVDFVGYRFFGEYTLLRKSTCKTFKRRMLSISSKRENNVSPTYSEWCSFNSYVGWLQHCDSFRLYQKYVEPNVEYMHNYYLKEVKGNAEICKRKNYSGERKAS